MVDGLVDGFTLLILTITLFKLIHCIPYSPIYNTFEYFFMFLK